MSVPKCRQSKSRTRKRRAHDAMTAINMSGCPRCSQPKYPHRVCGNCGFYKGEMVVDMRKL